MASPLGAATLRAGAITRFVEAFIGTEGDAGVVGMTAGLADEFTAANRSARGRYVTFDQRATRDPDGVPYVALQTARINLLEAIEALQLYRPEPQRDIGELFGLLAYIELFLAEGYCSGIPLSDLDEARQPVFGEPLTTTQMLERAVADFDSVYGYAGDDTDLRYLADVGRARALLNLGMFSEAAAAVAAVPTEYRYVTQNSTELQRNWTYDDMYVRRYWSVSDREGINGLDFRSASDPRVPTELVGLSTIDTKTPVYGLKAYDSPAAPVVLASGREARLIEAESLLRDGSAEAAVAKLNGLRASVPELDPLPLENGAQARVDQLFRERGFWLFATGHRHADLRRLVRQYGRSVESVFPTGPYEGGGSYAAGVVFTPAGEEPNPHFSECLSWDA